VISPDVVTIRPARSVRGLVRVPGDKSISHRALMLAALARGRSEVTGLAPGEDVRATLECVRRLGVTVSPARTGAGPALDMHVDGTGLPAFVTPREGLDAANSGTTSRLMMGVLAGGRVEVTLSGDASLQRRPMRRVVDPLERMGALIRLTDGRLPAVVCGRPLTGIDYEMPVASAQVKSAILLAALSARGETTVRESRATRDHTELALRTFGAIVHTTPGIIRVAGGQILAPARIAVPGDPSSAAFWACAAAALPGSDVEVAGVGLNPTRTGFLDVLRRFGAEVDVEMLPAAGPEPVGQIRVRPGDVRPVVISPEEVPGLIDELPVLAALATHGGQLSVSGAEELRVKESDRISALAAGIRAMGGRIEEAPGGFVIDGSRPLRGGEVDAAGDHRLAMAFAIAALGARGETVIRGAAVVAVSYPGFFETLDGLRA